MFFAKFKAKKKSPHFNNDLFWTKSIEIVDNVVCKLSDNQGTILLLRLIFEEGICVFRWLVS